MEFPYVHTHTHTHLLFLIWREICIYFFTCILSSQDTIRRQILTRLLSKFDLGLTREPIDLDYFEFMCRQELYIWCNALSRHVTLIHCINKLLIQLNLPNSLCAMPVLL